MSILSEVVSAAPETGVSSDKNPSDFETLRKKIFGNRDKSSRKKKTDPAIDETSKVEKELTEIFAGENWEEVASMYFNARFALTGWDGFLLTDPQKKTLGLSLATTMKMLLKIDPGYIAMIVFTANFGGIVLEKEMVYRKIMKMAEKENEGKRSA
jgi:hypothetical protein